MEWGLTGCCPSLDMHWPVFHNPHHSLLSSPVHFLTYTPGPCGSLVLYQNAAVLQTLGQLLGIFLTPDLATNVVSVFPSDWG